MNEEQQKKALELLKEAGASERPMDADHWLSWVQDVRRFLEVVGGKPEGD